MTSNKKTVQYTGYIVRDSNARKFLNRPAYSGNIQGIWSTIEYAQVFSSARKAQSCASNLNDRRPSGYSAYYAEVRPIMLTRRAPGTAK